MAAMKRKVLPARFYRTATGAEPVRKWLKALSREDKRIVGTDIATVEFGWPVGMPTCRPLASRRGLLEVRSSVTQNRIARVLYTSRTDGAPAWVHQEDTADARERFGPRCEAAEGG